MSDVVKTERDLSYLKEDELKIHAALVNANSYAIDHATGTPELGDNIFALAAEALDIPLSDVKRIRNLDSAFTAVSFDLFGRNSLEYMSQNRNVTQMVAEGIDMEGHTLNFVVDTTRKPKDMVEVGYSVGCVKNAGPMARIRKGLVAMAEAEYSHQ